MRTSLSLNRLAPEVAWAAGICLYGGFVALLLERSTVLAAAAGAAALVAAALMSNVARLTVAAIAGVWVFKRAPGVDVALTDILVAVTGVAAAFAGAGVGIHPRGRLVLRGFAVYLASLSITLGFNQSLHADLEWLHRIALVAGAIYVGAWAVQRGFHSQALRLLLVISCAFAVATAFDSVRSGFHAGQPFGYQKNYIGSLCATTLIVLVAAPDVFRLRQKTIAAAGALLVIGLLASQSRGAMVAAAVGVLIVFFRSPQSSRLLRLIAIGISVGLAVFAAFSIRDQLRVPNQHSSIATRVTAEQAVQKLWEHHPYTGVGLKFFKDPAYAGYIAPTNDFNEVLAEAGIVGFLGFVVFVWLSIVGLARLPGRLGTAALCAVAARFTHGLFDIYWSAGTTALPWMVAGMGLAGAGATASTTGRLGAPDSK